MSGLLDAIIDVAGVRTRVLNTHLDYRADPRVRKRQVDDMLNYLGTAPTRTIVCGDLNAGPVAPELQPLFSRLHDAWSSTSDSGFTYPADEPKKRIDYVLTTSDLRVRGTRVVTTLASDHRPVVTDLVLTAASTK
jgi:endonuclease/exonuclease/phosphatase family metal-dependent hydrolase